MIRVIFNQKGGVGKSSIAANLAALSAHQGHNTVLIDLDPQGNASQYLLGHQDIAYEHTIAHYFEQCLRSAFRTQHCDDFILETAWPKLDVIAAHGELSELQSKLESRHKIYKFRDLLAQLSEHYDNIIIDTPPAFNFYTLSALIGADHVLVPFDCDEFSRNALYNLLDNVAEVQADHNEQLTLGGIVINQFQARSKQGQRIVQQLLDEGQPVYATKLGASVIMRESHEACKPLIALAPKHKLTQQFIDLWAEIDAQSS